MREIWLLFSGPVAPRLAGKSAANANETKQSKQLQSARTKLIETEHYTQPCLVKAVTLPVFFCFFFILFLSVTAEVFFERALLREQWQSDVCSAESLMELKFCFSLWQASKFCGERFIVESRSQVVKFWRLRWDLSPRQDMKSTRLFWKRTCLHVMANFTPGWRLGHKKCWILEMILNNQLSRNTNLTFNQENMIPS